MYNPNAMNETATVIERLKSHGELFARAEIVGRWVWITFEVKPSADLREVLKAEGFRWNQSRQTWQHCGGRPSGHSRGNPKDNYGVIPATALDQERAA